MSSIFKNILISLVSLTLLGGCATVKPYPPSPSTGSGQQATKPARPVIIKKIPETPAPRAGDSQRTVALLSLVDQGRAYLKQNRPDAAIRVLERAVNLNPQRGESYYYLAQAWLMKKNSVQALEYNRLAESYLGDDPQWAGRVKTQRQKIAR